METLLHWDRELFFAINHGLSHPLLDPVMWLFTRLGLGWVQMLMVLGATLWQAQRRSSKWHGHLVRAPGGLDSRVQASHGLQARVARSAWREVFLPAAIAFLGSGLTVQLLKHAVPRLRPSNLPEALVAPDERIFYNSFPSGHTATAFALAFWVFLLTRGTRYRLWGYGALVVAGLVGLSRIYRGVHYPSDVLAGALIGILWGAVAYLSVSARLVPRAVESPLGSASASPRD
ncbi:MAG: phosphatase PAP2 family protein [Fimbriimonadales bacterium]|nr:phosphatase PAP2 family protein [Fimbriimonadales bacterium]